MIDGANPDANLLICPFSVQRALLMLLMAAREEAPTSISTTSSSTAADSIGFSSRLQKQAIAKHFSGLAEEFLECETLRLFRKLIVDKSSVGVPLKSDFVSRAKHDFDTEVEVFGLKEESSSADRINKWMIEKTNDQIGGGMEDNSGGMASLLKAEEKNKDVTTDLWLLVMDVIQFRCPWAIKFNAEETKTSQFWTSESESVEVEMMHLRDSCRYGFVADLDAAILELDCDFEDFSMLFILPESKTGLVQLETKLVSSNLMYLAAQLRRQDTLVNLPKFTVDVTVSLSEAVRKMNVADHVKSADFVDETNDEGDANKTTEKQKQLVSLSVLQKAVLIVGEEGAESDKQKIG